ncbi:MAG: helix-hairpin-helix domain-containing protein [Ignavibacteriales bacterium]|nr:helix-hairpin-helix domain-containing protein [Ignavibacteriales bacterium]
MLEGISKKIGLTQTELKISLFVIIVFIVGLTYKVFVDKQETVSYQIFDYSEEDEKFNNSSKVADLDNSKKSDDKEVDYKQEVLDFNTQSFDNIQKKTLPAEKSINLNTAKVSELVNLPGIGQKTAQNIIDYREQNKRFRNINELLNVKGIGESKLSKIKKYIFID